MLGKIIINIAIALFRHFSKSTYVGVHNRISRFPHFVNHLALFFIDNLITTAKSSLFSKVEQFYDLFFTLTCTKKLITKNQLKHTGTPNDSDNKITVYI